MSERKDEAKEISEVPILPDRSAMPAHPHNAKDRVISESPNPLKLGFLSVAGLIIVSISAGFLGGWLGNQRTSQSETVQKQQVVLKSQGQLINKIAKDVSPSVVSVEVVRTTAGGNFFSMPSEQRGAGTGIIIDKSGLIVTNRHVVPTGSSSVSVTLSDGTKYDDVQVIGRTAASDPLDVAFLKIKDTKGKTLTAATLGDSARVEVGDAVIAIGNALGQFQNTVTSGIISGHGRNLTAGDESGGDAESLQNLFQTDAAINQGNSGGPLVNLEGHVIGINTAIAAGDAQNIGFAIPINDIKGLIETVVSKGKLERPFLGVVFVPITADMAKQYDLAVQEGAYIPRASELDQDTVIDGGPADKAGIKEGDIITKVGNDKVDETHSLTSLLGKHKVGETVSLTIERDGKSSVVQVRLEASSGQ